MDVLINDPRLSAAYLVENADDVEEAIEAVMDAEPRYYQSAQGLSMYATDVTELPDVLADAEADLPLGQPKRLDLAE
jgi:hypothetical protein